MAKLRKGQREYAEKDLGGNSTFASGQLVTQVKANPNRTLLLKDPSSNVKPHREVPFDDPRLLAKSPNVLSRSSLRSMWTRGKKV